MSSVYNVSACIFFKYKTTLSTVSTQPGRNSRRDFQELRKLNYGVSECDSKGTYSICSQFGICSMFTLKRHFKSNHKILWNKMDVEVKKYISGK